MAQPINIGGVLYEPVGNGQMKVVGYADAPATQQGRVFTLPPNPKDVREQQRQAAADAREEERLRIAQKAEARAEQDFQSKDTMVAPPGDTTKTGEEYLATVPTSLAAQARALIEGRRAFPTGTALRSPAVQQLIAVATQADPTLDATNSATRVATRKDFTSGTAAKNITAMNTALGHLGTLAQAAAGLENRSFPIWNTLANTAETATGDPRVKNFTLARDAVANELMRVFRGTGGSLQEIEAWKNDINSSDSPEQLHAAITKATELLNSRLEAMNDQYTRGMGKSGDPIHLLSPHAQQVFNTITSSSSLDDLKPPPPGSAPPGGPGGSSGGGGGVIAPTNGQQRSTYDPRLSAQVDSLINANAPLSVVNAILKKQNAPAVTAASYKQARDWMAANPGKKYFGSDLSRTEDMNLGQRILANPAVAPIATGAVRAGDAASAGLLGAVSGDEGRGTIEAMGELHPDAALLGDVGGAIGGSMLGEGGAARLLSMLKPSWLKAAPLVGDALYGGTLGFNRAQPGEGAVGAAEGAAAGIAGNLLMRGAGSALRGVTDPAVQFLRSKGVPLTVGQALANSGRFGSSVKSIEDSLTGLPGVGNVVKARQRDALEGFNRAAFGDLPGHSGATGAEGVREGGQLVDNAYNFLDNTQLPLDAPYAGTEATIRATAPSRFAPDINDQLDMTASRVVNGQLPGRDWQSAIRANRANRSSVAGQPYSDPAIAAHNDIEQNLMGLAQRQGPPDTTANLDAANLLYSRSQTLAKALDNGPAQQADELFTPARLDTAARQGANQFQGRAQSIMGNRSFYDLTKAGRSVLPSTVPDSGTFTRGLTGLAVTSGLGAGVGGGIGSLTGDQSEGAGTGLGLALLLAAGGSKPAQRLMVKALTDRPDLAKKAGNLLYNNGWIGSGVLTPMLTGQ
jgi:hypothetical protein